MEPDVPPSYDALVALFSILLLFFAACGLRRFVGRCCSAPLYDADGSLTQAGHAALSKASFWALLKGLDGTAAPPTLGSAVQFSAAQVFASLMRANSRKRGAEPQRAPLAAEPPAAAVSKLSAPQNFYPLGLRLSQTALKTYGASHVLSIIHFLAL